MRVPHHLRHRTHPHATRRWSTLRARQRSSRRGLTTRRTISWWGRRRPRWQRRSTWVRRAGGRAGRQLGEQGRQAGRQADGPACTCAARRRISLLRGPRSPALPDAERGACTCLVTHARNCLHLFPVTHPCSASMMNGRPALCGSAAAHVLPLLLTFAYTRPALAYPHLFPSSPPLAQLPWTSAQQR